MAVNELRSWPWHLSRGGLHDAAVVLLLLRILGQVVPSHSGICWLRLVRWVLRVCLTTKQRRDLSDLSICVVRVCVVRQDPSHGGGTGARWGETRMGATLGGRWDWSRSATQHNATFRKGNLNPGCGRDCARLWGEKARHLRRESGQAQAMNRRERDGEWVMTTGALLLMKGPEIDCCGQLATEEDPRNGRKLTQTKGLAPL